MPFDSRDHHGGRGTPSIKLVAGNSNRPLADAICTAMKLPLTKSIVKRFADMEVFVEIHENVRGEDVYVLQSTSFPANDNLMETADPRRCAEAVLGPAHHGGDALLRLRAAGPQAGSAHADHRQARRQSDRARRRRPRDDARSACRPDPGLLRHPDRQPVRGTDLRARHPGALSTPRTSSSSRRTSAASCARARWPSASTARSPSATSGARRRACRRS